MMRCCHNSTIVPLFLLLLLLLAFCSKSSLSFSPLKTVLSTTPIRKSSLVIELKATTNNEDEDDSTTTTTTILDEGKRSNKRIIRPLHQNWWPVTTVGALSTTRPNPVELLNKKLVLFQDDKNEEEEGSWKCLDDQCSHRFAPLSEGRVVVAANAGTDGNDDDNNSCNQKKKCVLQCAYHGWEFDGEGNCQRAPQVIETQQQNVRSVTSYPVQEKAGMLFVWADPNTKELSKEITIPMFPLLETMAAQNEESYCFMRDLPNGFELLGENLLDLAHLPFSHHGVGGLSRDLGCPLPFKMLSDSQKSPDGPLYEASLLNASTTDPSLLAMKAPANSTLNLGFYDPCHVRYTRQTMPGRTVYVSLFLCPTSAGKSRVFLFNVFEAPAAAVHKKNNKKTIQASLFRQMIKNWTSLAIWKQKIQTALIKRIFTPVFSHQLGHKIFDGDGIFLHKQGNRMQNGQLTYRDYSTPGPADLMVNAFRRHLDAAIKVTREDAGEHAVANAFMPVFEYTDAIPRSTLLDRYESHTKHCKVCSAALQKQETKRARLGALQSVLFGSVGACGTALVALAALSTTTTGDLALKAVPGRVFKAGFSGLLAAVAALVYTKRAMAATDTQIQQFKFVDYVHAEKN